MRPLLKVVALAGGFALTIAWSSGRIGVAAVQEEPTVARSARGGLLAKSAGNQFEVFFYPTGLRLFPRSSTGAALDTSGVSGTATFYHPNSARPWFSRPLRAAGDSLELAVGLTNAPQSGAKVTFVLAGSGGSEGLRTSFTVPLEFVPQATTQPAAPAAATAPSPRYVYAPGYFGYGYYAYPGPQTAIQERAIAPTYYSAPPRYSSGTGSNTGSMRGHSVGPMHRDWSTGRENFLAKPWMQPRD